MLRPVALAAVLLVNSSAWSQVSTLPEVVITAEQDAYTVKRSIAGTRTDTPLEEIPQSVVVIPRAVIEDQGSQTLSDVLRNASNVTAIDQRDSNITGFKIRGFASATVVDGVPTPGVFQNNETLSAVEQVSVIKGPAGGLFGGSQGMNYSTVGGAIAITTAEPDQSVHRQIGLNAGSFNQAGASFDINQPISSALAIRLVGEYSDKNSETDRVYFKRQSLSPSFALTPNSNTKVVLRLRDAHNETLDYPGLPRATAGSPDVISGIPRSKFIGANGLPPSTNDVQGANLQWTQKLNDKWDFSLTLAQNKLALTEVGAFNASVIDAFLTPFGFAASFGLATQDIYGYRLSQKFESTVISPSLTGKFDAAGAQHTVSTGIDYEDSKEDAFMRWSDPFGIGISAMTSGVNLTGSTYATWIEPTGNSSFDSAYNRKFQATTGYVQDQIKVGNLSVLGSLRFNQLEIKNTVSGATTTKTASSTTPRLGAAYAFTPHVSTFAGYGESVQTPYLTTFAAGVTPTPENVKQTEAGLRLKDLAGVSASFAVFDLKRSNVATANAAGSNYLTDQGSQGFEMDLRWNATPSWQWIAAYTNQTSKYTGTSFTQVASFVGKQLFNIPKEQLRIATRYDIRTGAMQGVGLGLGVTNQSELPGDSSNSFVSPATSVWDAQVSYQTKAARYGLNVNNLFDKQYLTPSYYFGGGQMMPAAPRTLNATAVFAF